MDQFSELYTLTNRLLMTCARIRQSRSKNQPKKEAAEAASINAEAELSEAVNAMDKFVADYHGRESVKTSKTTAKTQKINQAACERLAAARAARIASGKLGGRPKKVNK